MKLVFKRHPPDGSEKKKYNQLKEDPKVKLWWRLVFWAYEKIPNELKAFNADSSVAEIMDTL